MAADRGGRELEIGLGVGTVSGARRPIRRSSEYVTLAEYDTTWTGEAESAVLVSLSPYVMAAALIVWLLDHFPLIATRFSAQ